MLPVRVLRLDLELDLAVFAVFGLEVSWARDLKATHTTIIIVEILVDTISQLQLCTEVITTIIGTNYHNYHNYHNPHTICCLPL